MLLKALSCKAERYNAFSFLNLGKNSIRQKATLKMVIKPRSENGIIFYIGKGQYDYLCIELFKGEVSSFMASFIGIIIQY